MASAEGNSRGCGLGQRKAVLRSEGDGRKKINHKQPKRLEQLQSTARLRAPGQSQPVRLDGMAVNAQWAVLFANLFQIVINTQSYLHRKGVVRGAGVTHCGPWKPHLVLTTTKQLVTEHSKVLDDCRLLRLAEHHWENPRDLSPHQNKGGSVWQRMPLGKRSGSLWCSGAHAASTVCTWGHTGEWPRGTMLHHCPWTSAALVLPGM